MRTTYVSAPFVRLGDYEVTTEHLQDDVRTHHTKHPRLAVLQRVLANSGVERRYWTRPLAERTGPVQGVAHRNSAAFRAAAAMGAEAAGDVLDAAGIAPGDVDAVVTSHTTSWSVPGLDIHLVEALGLRPDIARIPVSTAACAGGAHALIRAVDHVRARPGTTVLVTVAEALSTIVHADDTSVEHLIYRGLFGDAGAACLVTDRPLGAGFAVEDTYECVLPATRDRYWGRLDEAGFHFDSTRKAATAASDALPYLHTWLDKRPLSWGVVHPGGPGIITTVTTGLGLPEQAARHSVASLREHGNLGGAAILDVLRRAHHDPPADGEPGAVVAFGPGFALAGLHGAWHG